MSDSAKTNAVTEYSFRFDSFLLYLIQQTTQKSSAEILNFFNELSVQVSSVAFKNPKGRSIYRKVDDYFPGTAIPFHLNLRGYIRAEGTYYDWVAEKNVYRPQTNLSHIEIGFPFSPTYHNEKELQEIATMLMEKALLGAEGPELPPFEKPPTRASKPLKDIMDTFAGRDPEPKKSRKKKPKAAECNFCGHDTCSGCSAGGCV